MVATRGSKGLEAPIYPYITGVRSIIPRDAVRRGTAENCRKATETKRKKNSDKKDGAANPHLFNTSDSNFYHEEIGCSSKRLFYACLFPWRLIFAPKTELQPFFSCRMLLLALFLTSSASSGCVFGFVGPGYIETRINIRPAPIAEPSFHAGFQPAVVMIMYIAAQGAAPFIAVVWFQIFFFLGRRLLCTLVRRLLLLPFVQKNDDCRRSGLSGSDRLVAFSGSESAD